MNLQIKNTRYFHDILAASKLETKRSLSHPHVFYQASSKLGLALALFNDLSTVLDGDGHASLSIAGANALHFCQHVHSIDDLAKHDVSSVQVRRRRESHEELGAVCTWSRVCHRENAGALVLMNEVLVGELHSVDGLTASSIASREVASLRHESRNDSMEHAIFVVEWLA